MARARMVTRTIITNKVQFLAVNTETRNTEYTTLSIPASVPDSKFMSYAKKKFAETFGNKIVPVMVNTVTKEETLMGMPEEQFIQLATVLPPREASADVESEDNNA